jgi:hypothetical protein
MSKWTILGKKKKKGNGSEEGFPARVQGYIGFSGYPYEFAFEFPLASSLRM